MSITDRSLAILRKEHKGFPRLWDVADTLDEARELFDYAMKVLEQIHPQVSELRAWATIYAAVAEQPIESAEGARDAVATIKAIIASVKEADEIYKPVTQPLDELHHAATGARGQIVADMEVSKAKLKQALEGYDGPAEGAYAVETCQAEIINMATFLRAVIESAPGTDADLRPAIKLNVAALGRVAKVYHALGIDIPGVEITVKKEVRVR
jgi:hypothetical protein